MDDSQAQTTQRSGSRALARQTLHWFASLQLAVSLLLGLAAILAVATLLESGIMAPNTPSGMSTKAPGSWPCSVCWP